MHERVGCWDCINGKKQRAKRPALQEMKAPGQRPVTVKNHQGSDEEGREDSFPDKMCHELKNRCLGRPPESLH